VQASQPGTATANRISIYVFNLFGEREAPSGRQPEVRPVTAAPAAELDAAAAEAAAEEPAVDLE
jgi:hypothetical protein